MQKFFDQVTTLNPIDGADILFLAGILAASGLFVALALWISQLLKVDVSFEAARVGPEPARRARVVVGCVALVGSLCLLMGLVPGSRPMHAPTALTTLCCAFLALLVLASTFREAKQAKLAAPKDDDEQVAEPTRRAA